MSEFFDQTDPHDINGSHSGGEENVVDEYDYPHSSVEVLYEGVDQVVPDRSTEVEEFPIDPVNIYATGTNGYRNSLDHLV